MTLQKKRIPHTFRNKSIHPLAVTIEPWGVIFSIPPGSAAELTMEGGADPISPLEVQYLDASRLCVYVQESGYLDAYLTIDGVRAEECVQIDPKEMN